MKDIAIYFGSFGQKENYRNEQLGNVVKINTAKNFENPGKNDIAIIFVPEYRRSDLNYGADGITAIREQFYNLYKGTNWKKGIYDLGTIQPGETVSDTYSAIRDVVTELIKNDVFPIIIGGSQDLTYAVYQAYEKLEQTVNIIDVDSGLDLGDADDDIKAQGWLNKIVLHKPGYLFNYTLLAYQSYLVSPAELELLDKMYFDHFRLGEFYSDGKMMEPLVRNADIMSFDMNAIRSSDYRANSNNLPHGLYGEDACKIMRYAGLSDKLSSLGIYNFQANKSDSANDANLVAQMIWYFIEGFNQRKGDYPIGTKTNYTKYRVNLDEFKDEIVFYKSDKSGRWWMEVPYPKIEGVKFQRHLLVPCNYNVYEKSLQNEMPDLWWKTFKKLS